MKFKKLFLAQKFKAQQGFSLLEIIIVMAIIGTLVGIIVSRVAGGRDNANVGITETKAFTLQTKLIQYQLGHDNKFPTTEQGLQALTTNSGGVSIATDDDLKDAWGNPFDYKLTDKGPLLISHGKDPQSSFANSICFLSGKKLDSCTSVEGSSSN